MRYQVVARAACPSFTDLSLSHSNRGGEGQAMQPGMVAVSIL
jgi:hypothetical protein